MLSRTLDRLADLHAHLSPLQGVDNAVLKANHFDSQLAELGAILGDLKRLEDVHRELACLDGAMALLLELLQAAHHKQLGGDHLHCLLQPLVGKLNAAGRTLEEIL
ncbi:hypothetical protein [Pseudomonas aeruginosa]|jgi:hypothetical protein|uniref:hypothetical protein n=1 Tax=Pseudomonas aeruginosa TaxID=287 RepID=UPI00053EB09A|nr:hypothetical protein [Pseudomonas aeruginosa]EIU3806585.1 hypothetical protein [Pseudomonas aeruginosa]EIU3914602.1 hypothetical protein [Pseudomonas aeruginosa]EIU3969338.1 hypothetical protein [Pseudomonas aeruginosa]WGW30960.1 hypothetical protein P7I83_27960 [Pseudomonas aeruginosa]WGW43476.1 hypothetical protein P7I84_27980 [Pseudomonas aeruginosa]